MLQIAGGSSLYAGSKSKSPAQQLCFIENKGQVTDQDFKPRNDIQYSLQAPGINVFVGGGQLHYQFIKIAESPRVPGTFQAAHNEPAPVTITTYRLDVELVGANINVQGTPSGKLGYYEHYYTPGCGEQGATAHAYSKVTYKNVYPGIDWVIYIAGGKLEHEFVVGPGGRSSDIRLRYNGQTSLQLGADGSLVATTPLGTITEQAPVCYNAAGAVIPSAYSLMGNMLCYNTRGYKGPLVIDPVVLWGTYYGPDTSTSPIYALACDTNGHIYGAGLTWSAAAGSIATTGAFQTVFGGTAGMNTDAFLVKFDSSGNRLWATYVGGSLDDWGTAVSVDPQGSVYIAGVTNSTSGVSTAGSHQPAYGGGSRDAFLARFDSAGVRKWATYYGGTSNNMPSSVTCDTSGHVFMAGDANDNNGISTPGAYQFAKAGSWDGFLVKFDTAGVRQWGTYYGGTGTEVNFVHTVHGQNIYVAGLTPSIATIASSFAYQPAYGGGGSDAFVARFDMDGNRLWGTYYGGTGSETVGGITCDSAGNIYLLGHTTSDAAIASTGSYQPARSASSVDAFLVKLEPELGFRVWGTYYGGAGDEKTDISRITADDSGNVYIVGNTTSTSGIATTDGWQTAYGGGDMDGFFAKFTWGGSRVWATYYGGTATDDTRACAYDGNSMYICGQSNSTNNIATSNGFKPTGGGGASFYQGYLAKFGYPTYPPPDNTLVAGLSMPGALAVYPNPGTGVFTLAGTVGNSDATAQVAVTDVAGRNILTTNALISEGKLNMRLVLPASVPPGIYIVKVATGADTQVLRLIKE